jgi:hypothetical protein
LYLDEVPGHGTLTKIQVAKRLYLDEVPGRKKGCMYLGKVPDKDGAQLSVDSILGVREVVTPCLCTGEQTKRQEHAKNND